MTDLEKWAVFFRYADIPRFRQTVNNVIESKEALQMAGNLLMSISQDERERAVFRSRRIYQSDMDSNIATVRDRGILEGRKQRDFEFAQKLLKRNRPIEEIMEDTGLTREEVESQRTTH